MPQFKVNVSKTIGFTALVEAESADDAFDLVSALEDSDFDVNSFRPEEVEVEDEQRGNVAVTISPAEDIDFDVHWPAVEVS